MLTVFANGEIEPPDNEKDTLHAVRVIATSITTVATVKNLVIFIILYLLSLFVVDAQLFNLAV